MKIKTYKTKGTIDGYKLAPGLRDKTLVAIPESKLPSPSETLIIYIHSLDGTMYLRHSDMSKCLASIPFRDKWGRGSYHLCYFEVRLDQQQYYFDWGGGRKIKSEVNVVRRDC